MKRVLILIALCLSAWSPGPKAAVPPSVSMAFEGGLWFDGERFVPAQWYAVGGRFTADRPDRVDVTVDLSGRYVLPPLVEAHNHDLQNGPFAAVSVDKNLRHGVFYSVQMCARPQDVEAFSGLLNKPGTLDVAYVAACITASDGHPLGIALASSEEGETPDLDELRQGWDVIDTVADLDRLWPAIAARDAQLIKLIVINSERQAANRADPALFGHNGLDPELIAPIVVRAHAAGKRVVAHADTAADFAAAVAAGADMIAHLPGYRIANGMTATDYRITDPVIAEAARRGVVVITTASAARHDMARRPHNAESLRTTQIDNLRRLREAGVALAIGSDDVMGVVVDELAYLDALQIMPRAELLRRATRDTAEAMFPGRAIGRFANGYEASLIAFDADPLTDLSVLRTPRLLVKQGEVLAPYPNPQPAPETPLDR